MHKHTLGVSELFKADRDNLNTTSKERINIQVNQLWSFKDRHCPWCPSYSGYLDLKSSNLPLIHCSPTGVKYGNRNVPQAGQKILFGDAEFILFLCLSYKWCRRSICLP